MRAILEQDIIRNVVLEGGVDVGPKLNAPLDRLRYDGLQLVDLATMSAIWVEPIGKYFQLHAVQVPNSQLVAMQYRERVYLTRDPDGTIRLTTQQERDDMERIAAVRLLKDQLHGTLQREIGEIEDRLQDIYKLIFALIVYARTGNAQVEAFFDQLVPIIIDTYPLDRVRDELIAGLQKIKTAVEEYYQQLDEL